MQNRVVSFADGAGNYLKSMARLKMSLREVKFSGDFNGYDDYKHIGSPFHRGLNSIPYAFKPYSIKKAIKGADILLWCDSPVYATKSIEPVFQHIKEHGYVFFDNVGFSIGDYTSDACLAKWGMSREEAFDSKMIMACCMGFDLNNPTAKEFLKRYINAVEDGVSYQGDWFNQNLQVSNDMRVKGHRHDQSVASIIIKQMGLEVLNGQQTFFAYDSHKGILPISDTVCLWSAGL